MFSPARYYYSNDGLGRHISVCAVPALLYRHDPSMALNSLHLLKVKTHDRWFGSRSRSPFKWFRYLVVMSFIILVLDFIYKRYNDISYVNKSKCFLNQALPPFLFLFYEYFIELVMIVIVGIYVSVVLESWFSRYRRFYPTNPVTAFLYASVIPVCSCSVLPLMETLNDKVSYRTLVTFIVAAPLLNPYIIVLSFTLLGPLFGVLRIAGAFVLAVSVGVIMDLLPLGHTATAGKQALACGKSACIVTGGYMEKSYGIFRKILPYLLLAGLMGMGIEWALPHRFLGGLSLGSRLKGLLLFSMVGIPIYFCNGADILFLRPLVCSGMGLGTAISFSLTSTAICISSFIMLLKFMGRKQTVILTAVILILSLGMGLLINVLTG